MLIACLNRDRTLFLAFLLFACGVSALPEYAKVYPDFLAACVVSQKKSEINGSDENWGHITFYLNRTCLDNSGINPRLKNCPEKSDGTWVSVNAMFKNTNWIGAEGWDFGLRGTLSSPDEVLSKKAFDLTKEKLISTQVFKNLEYHEEWVKEKPVNQSLLDYMATKSLDMDFATTFGRNVQCAFISINDSIRRSVVDFLNRKNEEYSDSKKKAFVWSPFKNNCAHLTYNTLSSFGLWPAKDTDSNPFSQLFSLAIPSRVYSNFMEIKEGSEILQDPERLVNDSFYWDLLEKKNWLPIRQGVLTEFYPVIAKNEIYQTKDLDLFVFDWNPLRPNQKKLRDLLQTSSVSLLLEDKKNFQKNYKDALLKTDRLLTAGVSRNTDRLKVYKAYLEGQLAEVSAVLNLNK